MCGLVGIVGCRPDQTELRRMLQTVESRGPDDQQIAVAPWYGIGFARLAIVDLEGGHQPTSEPEGLIRVMFNGEIYNVEDLKRRLARDSGVCARSEAEVILYGYRAMGDRILTLLDGDFAVAIFDNRTRRCLLARDRMGIKPLYYSILPTGVLLFSSTPRAFFRHTDFDTKIDNITLSEKTVLGFCAVNRTIFEAIRQIPPGCFLDIHYSDSELTLASCSLKNYYDREKKRQEHLSEASVEQTIECCRGLISAAIRRRVRHCSKSDPIFVSLSGGIDSTIIALIVARECTNNVVAITVSDTDDSEDVRYAIAVARHLSIEHVLHRVSIRDFDQHFGDVVIASGGTAQSYTSYFLGLGVRQQDRSARVLISGDGADEMFLGYHYLQNPNIYVQRVVERLSIINPDHIEGSVLLSRATTWKGMAVRDMWREVIALFERDQLVNSHLIPCDHGPMAFGVENRVPFLDTEIVEIIGALSPSARLLGPGTKGLLRLVLARECESDTALARKILGRQKAPAPGATAKCRDWMAEQIELANGKGSSLSGFSPTRSSQSTFDAFWLRCVQKLFFLGRAADTTASFRDLLSMSM
jgi:asparagine synthase (glutamine-hydrolysing)